MPEGSQGRERAGQKSAEKRIETLRHKGGAFVTAVEVTRMPMVICDARPGDSPIIFANGAFLEMSGWGLDEVLGQPLLFLAGPDVEASLRDRVRAALSGAHSISEEISYVRRDGEVRAAIMNVGPVQDGDRVTQQFASFIDITRRVRTERELQEAKAELERRVNERTRRLERANARLQEELERRGRMEAVLRDTLAQREEDLRYRALLAREVDHRTKNALQLASSLLQVQALAAPDPATAEALRSAQSRLSRIAEVHTLLYQGDQPDIVDFGAYLRRLAQEAVETLVPVPGQVEIEVDADDAPWPPGLVIPLGLIVGEALTNAIKHAFPGGRAGRIAIRLHGAGSGAMRLLIEDDGVGMPDKHRQGPLGMELIRTFAQQIRGTASVEPGRLGGTCVAVTFPAPAGDAVAGATTARTAVEKGTITG
ncbi:MAG TPA: histidine kinase dimerization/phosphoacceptor domain -containing protein [Azospirillaceae bacterium]|nr:histidine kinase dimerization/phosphoacceptor domain -containing protein [Azospirillaceae bacterium]